MEQPVVRPAEKPRDNVWHARTLDGQDRSHIPPMAKRLFFVRIAQLVLAVAYLVLAAFAAFTLNASTLPGFAFAFFVFSWTVVYFVWLVVSIFKYPIAYHWIAHISVEALTNIFWLASWATFASYASAINLPGAERTFPPPPETTVDGSSPVFDFTWSTASEVMAAKVAIAVDAAIGAAIWVLFCVTLFATVLSIVRLRKHRKGVEPTSSHGPPAVAHQAV